ncbi:MAG: endonuclease domain-containing protein [Micromonosporaceae bacterium]
MVHQLVLEPSDIMTVDGVRTTTPARAVADLLLRLGRYSAVAVVDSSLNRGLVKPDEINLVRRLLHGRRGAVAARRHLAEADGRAESPLETRVRLRCVDGGVRPETLQHPVHSRLGQLLGYGDLAWPSHLLIAEADGVEVHSRPRALIHDRRRQNDFANAGYTVLRFTWQDTMSTNYIPIAVRAARAR